MDSDERYEHDNVRRNGHLSTILSGAFTRVVIGRGSALPVYKDGELCKNKKCGAKLSIYNPFNYCNSCRRKFPELKIKQRKPLPQKEEKD